MVADVHPVTQDMERHMRTVELFGPLGYRDPVVAELEAAIDGFLDDPANSNFDDSIIYDAIAREDIYASDAAGGRPRGRRGRPGGRFGRAPKKTEPARPAEPTKPAAIERPPRPKRRSGDAFCGF
jgi:hypothetical protein